MNPVSGLRTWVEIDPKALEHNLKVFLNLIPLNTKFMAVIKSNAYGHGLVLISKLLSSKFSVLGASRLWFGVDSIVEGLRLRREEIKNSILVLGSTLPERMKEAAAGKIIISISSFDSLRALSRLKLKPDFHLKIDTGMHRQGFLPADVPKLIKLLKLFKLRPQGIFTHFAAAGDITYPTYTLEQLKKFNQVVSEFRKAGLKNLIRHAAASGATLLFPQSHLDMIRVGMGLYGYWPSMESRITYQELRKRLSLDSFYRGLASIELRPALSWKTLITEIKKIPKGSYVGYNLTEQVTRDTETAVLPIGYWHGYDRGLSSVGEVLIRGRRAKILGRVSMDMIVVDITGIPLVKIGNEAVLIGRQKQETIWADELAMKIGTSQYEFLTRINPLIKRVVV